MKAQKYNALKVDFRSIDPAFLAEMAKIFDYGRVKYSEFNFAQGGLSASDFYSAIMRHLLIIGAGELEDSESGCSHLAHIACGALMWYTNLNLGNLESGPVFRPGSLSRLKSALVKNPKIIKELLKTHNKNFTR